MNENIIYYQAIDQQDKYDKLIKVIGIGEGGCNIVRFMQEQGMKLHPFFKLYDIIEAMSEGVVIEFIYRNKQDQRSYALTAPICLKEVNGNWYLLGSDSESNISIYDLENFISIGKYWATFSLPVDFSIPLFIQKHFNLNTAV